MPSTFKASKQVENKETSMNSLENESKIIKSKDPEAERSPAKIVLKICKDSDNLSGSKLLSLFEDEEDDVDDDNQ